MPKEIVKERKLFDAVQDVETWLCDNPTAVPSEICKLIDLMGKACYQIVEDANNPEVPKRRALEFISKCFEAVEG